MNNEQTIDTYSSRLKKRFYELREEIRQELLQSDEQQYIDLAGKVHDMQEQSVAELLVDLKHASVNRHIDEIRDLDAALIRIANGTYGICGDCGEAIAPERLQAFPVAKRCHDCQRRYEQSHIQAGHHSL